MKGQQVGYVRVSSLDQNENRQLEGIELDRTFLDKASGKDVKRPQLTAMLAFVREGDAVVCHSMDRLRRNLDDLRKLMLGLTASLGGFLSSMTAHKNANEISSGISSAKDDAEYQPAGRELASEAGGYLKYLWWFRRRNMNLSA